MSKKLEQKSNNKIGSEGGPLWLVSSPSSLRVGEASPENARASGEAARAFPSRASLG